MRSILLFVVFIALCNYSYSQNNRPDVMSSAGGSISNNQYLFDWTLGEAVIETIIDSNIIFTQGFQQPDFYVVNVVEYTDFFINVYPNPASNEINIKTNTNKKFRLILFDLSGSMIQEMEFIKEAKLDISELSKSVYLLKIIDQENESMKIMKIVKAR